MKIKLTTYSIIIEPCLHYFTIKGHLILKCQISAIVHGEFCNVYITYFRVLQYLNFRCDFYIIF